MKNIKKCIPVLLGVLVLPLVAQAKAFKCEYGFSGSPMGNVVLELNEDGQPKDTAEISLFFSPARQVPVTMETPAAGELWNMTFSKGDPSNEVVMIVYPQDQNGQKSKLINPAAPPIMRELQGTCL